MGDLKILENELVPVYETSTGEKVVYGTELYACLGSKRQYTDWIRNRLHDCDAVENEDFQNFSQNCEKSAVGRPKHEYIIKLDTAKEMAMLERNEKGKQVRRYFIQVEKKYKKMVSAGIKINIPRLDSLHIRAMELINECEPERMPYMKSILEDAGICIGNEHNDNVHTEFQVKFVSDSSASAVQTSSSTEPQGFDSVRDFLKGVNVNGRPTNDVYAEYTGFCHSNGLKPVSNIVFTKYVNRLLGTRAIQKKLNGVNRKIFVY